MIVPELLQLLPPGAVAVTCQVKGFEVTYVCDATGDADVSPSPKSHTAVRGHDEDRSIAKVTGTLTVAVDGSGDRELFSTFPDDCDNFYRPAWSPVDQSELALPCVRADESVAVYRVSVDGKLGEHHRQFGGDCSVAWGQTSCPGDGFVAAIPAICAAASGSKPVPVPTTRKRKTMFVAEVEGAGGGLYLVGDTSLQSLDAGTAGPLAKGLGSRRTRRWSRSRGWIVS